MRKNFVDAAPFVAILEHRYEQLQEMGVEAPRDTLIHETGISERNLYRLMYGGQKEMSFDNADRVVTRILGPMAWYSDPELNEIYVNVDLAAIDRAFPVSALAAA